jgi:hypothetical protein
MEDMETKFQDWKPDVRRADGTGMIKIKRRLEGCQKSNDNPYIGQHEDSSKRYSLRRRTRSRWDASTGTRLLVRDGETEEDTDLETDLIDRSVCGE